MAAIVVTALMLGSALESRLPFSQAPPDRSPAKAVPVYPGATAYCSEHVIGAPQAGKPGPHLDWTAYHSPDPPVKVVAFYRTELGTGSHRHEDGTDIWRLPFDRPDRVVSVTTVEEAKPAPKCAPPPATTRTVIIVSTMTRP
jgi:hypothetical protein